MTKLTDLEICKKIAEIEGLDKKIETALVNHEFNRAAFERYNPTAVSNPYAMQKDIIDVYNPLTDKAILLDLILKYRVNIDHDGSELSIWHDNGQMLTLEFYKDDEFPRAALLAIIETHDNG